MAVSQKAKELIAKLGDGTRLGDIKKLAKDIKIDHALAQELWAHGAHNPRLLATLIFDKKLLSESDLDLVATDLAKLSSEERNQLSDWLLANQLTKDKKLVALLESWQQHASPVMRRWFWYYQARQRWTGRTPPAGSSAKLMDAIEADIAAEDPDVQWVMNFCAGWIGVYEDKLRTRCVKLGKQLALYKDEPVARNCTPSYLPEFIRIEVAKRA